MLSQNHQDFIVGSNGHAGLSNRKVAELLKVNHTSVGDTLKPGVLFDDNELQSIAAQGFQGGVLIKLATRFAKSDRVKPETRKHCLSFLEKAATIGAQTFIDQMAGIITPAPSHQLPATYLEALEALVATEKQRLLLQAQNEELQQENEALAEAVDELFEYSSIVRIAKFNNCSEKLFNWRELKAASKLLRLEVKQVPCPRFGMKNLYSHDAWRYVYPGTRLPETTTLAIRR